MKDFKERYKLSDYFYNSHSKFEEIADLFYESRKSILNGNFTALDGNIDYVESAKTYRVDSWGLSDKFDWRNENISFPGFTKVEIDTETGFTMDKDMYDYDVLKGTLSASDYLADMISYENGNCAIIELIDKVYDMKPNRKNYMQSAHDIENGRKFLASALERECNTMIRKFQNNEISKRTFEKYIEIYEDCKNNKLPKMVSNWENKQELRDQLKLADERKHERKIRRANFRATVKSTVKSNIKSGVSKIKKIPEKLRELHAERKAYRAKKAEIKEAYELKRRQEIIDKFREKRDVEMDGHY